MTIHINKKLLISQKVTAEQLENIRQLHTARLFLEESMKTAPIYRLSELNEIWIKIQSDLQLNWNFNQDVNFVRFWDVPRCSFPKMDNEERYPYGRYIINTGCPVHGSETGDF